MEHYSRPVIISFSGIDGAGKSTQIERLCSRLFRSGVPFARLALWDDIVPLARWRSRFSHRILKSERGVGTPEKPVKRLDKNVRPWYLTMLRGALYLFDALCLRHVIQRSRGSDLRLLVFDRYIYDQLANIPLNRIGRVYVQVVLKIVPAADIAFLLDAEPQAAFDRKPEYPLQFLTEYRLSYLNLQRLIPEAALVSSAGLDSVEQSILSELKARIPGKLLSLDYENSGCVRRVLDPAPASISVRSEPPPSGLSPLISWGNKTS